MMKNKLDITKESLRKILNCYDPMGIILKSDASSENALNFDEYDPEIKQILILFEKTNNLEDFKKEVYQIFIQLFDKTSVGDRERFDILSEKLYDYLLKNLTKNDEK